MSGYTLHDYLAMTRATLRKGEELYSFYESKIRDRSLPWEERHENIKKLMARIRANRSLKEKIKEYEEKIKKEG